MFLFSSTFRLSLLRLVLLLLLLFPSDNWPKCTLPYL